jgi:hypothetical protein
MANERTIPEDLIAELVQAAEEFAPADAETFAAEAREDLAAYRLRRQTIAIVRDREGRPRRTPVFVVPERYAGRAEVFVVFEVFVRHFVDPILVAAEVPDLLRETDDSVERLGFARFGEDALDTVDVRDSGALREDASALAAMAQELGRDLFGERFRSSDFWGNVG